MKSPSGIETFLRDYNVEDLESHDGTIYGLWADLCLAYVNPAWYRFARENDGEPAISTHWDLGASVLDAFSQDLRSYFETVFSRCLNSNEPWEHDYECSSEDLYRRFHQTVYPLKQSALLVVNSLIVEAPHDSVERPPRSPDEAQYRDAQGFIHQCAHCRRVRNFQANQRWDWVPVWVARIPEKTSHTFCPTCFGYYYPLR